MEPRRHSAAAPGLSGRAGPSRRQSGRVPRTLLRRLGTAPAAGDAGNDAAAPPHVTFRADPRAPSARAVGILLGVPAFRDLRSEEHTSELQSLMRISYAVFCLKKKNKEK